MRIIVPFGTSALAQFPALPTIGEAGYPDLVRTDGERWRQVIQTAGIRIE